MAGVPNRILRKMGYLADRRGIADRYVMNRAAWEGHLGRTKDFILSILPEGGVDTVAVLGSGWLLDLPVDEILQLAGRIHLYDIAHPSQVTHLISKQDKIIALTEDLTGGAVLDAWQAVHSFRKTRRKPDVTRLFRLQRPDIKADLLISLNLLSQLGAMVTDYLGRYIPYDHEELEEINRMIQEEHLCWLKETSSCLITDFEEVITDLETGNVHHKRLIHASLPEARRSKEWEWHFDTDGGYYAGKKVVLKVIASDLRQS